MRAVVQRVAWAKVSVDGEVIGRCGKGLLCLVAAKSDDTHQNAKQMAEKIRNIRIFSDSDGKMNLSLADLPPSSEPQVLLVSNFTVYGNTAKGRRPSFVDSAPFELGKSLMQDLLNALREQGVHVETGEFGADMQVELLNDGPVTVLIDT